MPKRRTTGVTLCMALALALGVAATVPAQDDEGHLSPDHPMPFYWFRTERPAEPAPMLGTGPRLREVAEAFGRSDLALARSRAQQLLDSADTVPAVRAEAKAYLIESYLAEGEFAQARAAAAGDQAATQRVATLESAYEAEVSRLQRIVATTVDREEAARAQLQTAAAHERAGRNDTALESYRKTIDRYPDSPYGATALRKVARLYQQKDRQTDLVEQVLLVTTGSYPNTAVGREAQEQLAILYYNAARGSEGNDDLPGAIAAWAKALEFDSVPLRRARAALRIADALISQKREREALPYLQQLQADGRPDLRTYRDEAEWLESAAYYQAGETDKALAILWRVAESVGHSQRQAAKDFLGHLGAER